MLKRRWCFRLHPPCSDWSAGPPSSCLCRIRRRRRTSLRSAEYDWDCWSPTEPAPPDLQRAKMMILISTHQTNTAWTFKPAGCPFKSTSLQWCRSVLQGVSVHRHITVECGYRLLTTPSRAGSIETLKLLLRHTDFPSETDSAFCPWHVPLRYQIFKTWNVWTGPRKLYRHSLLRVVQIHNSLKPL